MAKEDFYREFVLEPRRFRRAFYTGLTRVRFDMPAMWIRRGERLLPSIQRHP